MEHYTSEYPVIYHLEANTVQQLVGNFIYYARMFDATILVALNSITPELANITQSMAKAVVKLLNYYSIH